MAAVRAAPPPSDPARRAPQIPTCARAPQIRQHFQSFLAGGIVALSAGYYKLHQDIWHAAEAVDTRLDHLGRESIGAHSALQARVSSLETEVASLKAQRK